MFCWTTETPRKPGHYWVSYRGVKSRAKRVEIVELGWCPEGYMLNPIGSGKRVLAIKDTEYRPKRFHYRQIHFHPDCGVVKWAGPIPKPQEPAP